MSRKCVYKMWRRLVCRNSGLAPINIGSATVSHSPRRHASTGRDPGAAGSYLHNPGSEPLRYTTTGAALAAAADSRAGCVALRSVHEGVTLTYEQLLTQADALGCALRAMGVDRGDRLGIWSHNCVAWVVALVAALRVGVVVVAINPVYELPELRFCLQRTGVRALLLGAPLPARDYHQLLLGLAPELPASRPGRLQAHQLPHLRTVLSAAGTAPPGTVTCESLVKAYEKQGKTEASKYDAAVSPDDGSIIHFTSGTTGDPKAAVDTHFGVVNNTYYIGKRNTLLEEEHRVCVQAPMFHGLGSVITVLSALSHGAALVLPAPTYSATANTDALYSEQCTLVIGTPTMFVDLVSRVRARSAPPPRLRVALTAGAPCSPQLFTDIQHHLKAHSVNSIYGMTETTASVFQSIPGESMEQVTQTVGYLQDHVEVKVVDEDEKMVPFGQPGQLLVRGYNVMRGYWDEPEKTRQTVGADGWLRTGDIFTLSTDGYGRVVGRQKDVIVRGGENIAPKEIEDHIDTHPDVLETQVVGVPDARLGEEVAAVLRMRAGAAPLDAAALRQHCAGVLARYKVPRLVRHVHEFPKTASGKIQKYKLRQMLEEGSL